MSWKQFLWWKAFDRVEPIGEKRADWQAASICAATTNAILIARGVSKRFRVKDFLLEFDDEQKPVAKEAAHREGKTWQEMKFIAQMWAEMANAEESRKHGRKP